MAISVWPLLVRRAAEAASWLQPVAFMTVIIFCSVTAAEDAPPAPPIAKFDEGDEREASPMLDIKAFYNAVKLERATLAWEKLVYKAESYGDPDGDSAGDKAGDKVGEDIQSNALLCVRKRGRSL